MTTKQKAKVPRYTSAQRRAMVRQAVTRRISRARVAYCNALLNYALEHSMEDAQKGWRDVMRQEAAAAESLASQGLLFPELAFAKAPGGGFPQHRRD